MPDAIWGCTESKQRPPDQPASHPLEIRLLKPGEEQEADRFVTACPLGTFFHLSGWKRIIERILKRPCFWLTAWRDTSICGVFPISLVRNKLFGDCMVSLPLVVYGGICATDKEAYFGLLEAGKDLATGLRVDYLEMRNATEPFETSLPGRDLYVTFTQDLSPGPERLFQALPRDTRYAIRKAHKAGLTWTEDLTDQEFYDIFSRSFHRLGTPVFPQELFLSIRSEFPNACRLFAVRKGRQAVAGVFSFYFRDQVIPYYGGSLVRSLKDSPNNFMYWSLIEQSCREGYHTFDFGRSKRGSGSFHFKSAWSMQVTGLPYRYHLIRAKQIVHLSSADPKFQLPVAIWKRMPYSWTRWLGPKVVRWIPSI
jgi:FemAB-related protein (PEP-CTERM system-associated)